jgi:predicted DsbA family dithiol-disulfide isomerase
VQVEWRAFLLRPDTPPEGRELPYPPDVLEQRMAPLRAQADELGLPMTVHERVSNSRPALEAAEYAREQRLFEPFHRAAFHAYWAEGRDIGRMGVLREIAESVGLDPDGMEQALDEQRYTARVESDHDLAVRIGFTGVPAFILGNRAIIGAQPYQAFEQVMAQLGRSKRRQT